MQDNTRTVWITYHDEKRDVSDSRRFGEPYVVFDRHNTRSYEGSSLLNIARHHMAGWRDGDSLLMLGDPALCALCAMVALERSTTGRITLLRWNRRMLKYDPLVLDMHDMPQNDEVDDNYGNV